MSYDPKLEGMLAMAETMRTGSASEGLETVQNSEQNRARNACRLPKDMRPSKEAFEALGFTFKDIGDDVLYQATLPEGWSMKSDGSHWTYILDDKGRKRASSFYKGACYDRNGHMYLCHRFYATHDAADPLNWKGPFTFFVTDADGTVLFTAGESNKSYCRELDQKSIAYLDTNYPDWRDPTKYWD